MLRRYRAASPPRGARDELADVWLCAPRRHRPAHWIDAVYALEVVTPAGEPVHTELVVARQALARPESFRTADGLVRWAQAWMKAAEPLVARAAGLALKRHITTVTTIIRRAAQEAADREAIVASASAAASTRVQAGLFDLRALRMQEGMRRSVAARAAEAQDAQASATRRLSLTPRLRLVALVPR